MVVKKNVSFTERCAIINKVVEDCFIGGEYTPENYEISYRTAMISAFCPEFDLSSETNNELWEKVNSDEALEILHKIDLDIDYGFVESIDNAINHRLRIIENTSYSMTDVALSSLLNILSEKIESIDLSSLSKDNIGALVNAANEINNSEFADSLVKSMINNGVISKEVKKTAKKK